MNRRVKVILSVACIAMFTLRGVNAATFTVDPSAGWIGFVNVFEIGAPGYGMEGAGAFVFQSIWGTSDLIAGFSGPVLTLRPNSIGDPNPFWYTPGGGPGSTGNKIMSANMYVEPAGSLPGQIVTFTGLVLENTLALGPVDAMGHGWTSYAFIKDFAPDFSSWSVSYVPLTPGPFSVSLSTVYDEGRHVQYGFETIGPDVWVTDAGQYGNIQITAIPEPSSIGLALTGLLGLAVFARKQRK